MQVTLHTARSQLSTRLEAALACEDVAVARGAVPVVQIPDTTPAGLLDDLVTTIAQLFLQGRFVVAGTSSEQYEAGVGDQPGIAILSCFRIHPLEPTAASRACRMKR